jgi:hypothetical protein
VFALTLLYIVVGFISELQTSVNDATTTSYIGRPHRSRTHRLTHSRTNASESTHPRTHTRTHACARARHALWHLLRSMHPRIRRANVHASLQRHPGAGRLLFILPLTAIDTCFVIWSATVPTAYLTL